MDREPSGNVAKLAPFLSKDVTGVMVTGEEVKGLEGRSPTGKRSQDLIGPGGRYHVTVNVDKTDFYGDAAISRGNTEMLSARKWKGVAVCIALDFGLRRRWRLEGYSHASSDEFRGHVFVSLKAQRDKLRSALVACFAGAILAFAIQSLRRRPGREPAKAFQ